MWWLTLRLQRAELILLIIAVLAAGGAFVATANEAIEQARTYTNPECPVSLTRIGETYDCRVEPSEFYRLVSENVPNLIVLPLLVALLLSIPVLMELHDRTYRLAWTQSAVRGNWVRTRLALILVVGLGVTALSILLVRWWLPTPSFWTSVRQFDLAGIVALGWLVFAAGLVLAVGTVLRRPLVALVASALMFVIARAAFMLEIRPFLIPPRSMTTNDPSMLGTDVWVIDDWYQRADGARLSQQQAIDLCVAQGRDQIAGWLESCQTANGFVRHFEYQPASRYWPLQFAETGLVGVIGIALIGWTVWYWLRRLE